MGKTSLEKFIKEITKVTLGHQTEKLKHKKTQRTWIKSAMSEALVQVLAVRVQDHFRLQGPGKTTMKKKISENPSLGR